MSETAKKNEKMQETEAAIDVKSMNIFQRVAAITAELGTVAKNLNVSAGKGSYKAVSERDIIDAVKPLEAKYRVYSYPSDRKILESETLESEKTYNGNTTKSTTFFTRVQTEYTFVNIDDPKDIFKTIVFSEGIDPGDKGSGKAMTYADKYAVMKAYKISTGDDPDEQASEPTNYTRSGGQNNKPQGGNYQGNNNRSNNNQGNNYRADPSPAIQCRNCGKQIQDTYRPDGSLMTASEVAYYSSQRHGLPYCVDCWQKLEAQKSGQR